MNSYMLTAASRDALADMLEAAQTGKARPFVTMGFGGGRVFDPARITNPEAVMRDDGAAYALLDPDTEEPVLDTDTGAPVMIQPQTVDYWRCMVCLETPDADLAALETAL